MSQLLDNLHKYFDLESKQYRALDKLESIGIVQMNQARPFSKYVAQHPGLKAAISILGSPLHFALIGYHDQAIFEVEMHLEGTLGDFSTFAELLDTFTPEQNGDMVMVMASTEWDRIITAEFSFDNNTVEIARFTPKP